MEAQKHEISKVKGFIQIGNEMKRCSDSYKQERIVVLNKKYILPAKICDLEGKNKKKDGKVTEVSEKLKVKSEE
ncbi:MAG: hypothetical protein IJ910_11135 [Bacteroidaceae bacterium]|nr:hypothetical protein [Bacteroidaceae bacterium]